MITAVKSATAWGITQGLVDEKLEIDFRSKNNHSESPFENFRVSALSKQELAKLIHVSHNNLRDKALLLTIIITRANSNSVRELTTQSLSQNESGVTTIAIDNEFIPIPDGAKTIILNYAQDIKPGLLFPSKTKPKESLTRQAMHLIFQKYKKETGLTRLNHSALVKTGVQMFGTPENEKIQN